MKIKNKIQDKSGLKINLNPPFFPDNTQPNGALIDDPACQACWYYFILATKQLDQTGSIDSQILLEGEPWQAANTDKIRLSITKLYGIEPNDLDRYWNRVWIECKRLGLPEPSSKITGIAQNSILV